MEKERHSEVSFITVGNALTVARLILLPVIIVGIVLGLGYLAVAGMAAVVLTDLLDGRISRRMGQASAFGGTLDSTIDFVLIYSLFIAFYAAGRLATYQFAIIYVAMLTNLMLQLFAMGTGQGEGVVRISLGKLTGALQYGYLLFLVVREVLPKTHPVATVNIVLFVVLAVGIVLSSIESVVKLRKMVSA